MASDYNKIIVSGAGEDRYNGEYVDTGKRIQEYPVYALAEDSGTLKAFMYFDGDWWCIANGANIGTLDKLLEYDYTYPDIVTFFQDTTFGNAYENHSDDITSEYISNHADPPAPIVTLKSAADEPETEGGEYPEVITVSNSNTSADGEYPKIERTYNGKPIYAVSKVVNPEEGLPAVFAFVYKNDGWELGLFNPVYIGTTIDEVINNADDQTLDDRINGDYFNSYYRYSETEGKWVIVYSYADQSPDVVISFNPGGEPSTPEGSDVLYVSECTESWLNGEYTKIEVSYKDNPVYACDLTDSNYKVSFIYFDGSQWTLAHVPTVYATNKDGLIAVLSGNAGMSPDTFIEDLGFANAIHFKNDTLVGQWGSNLIVSTTPTTEDPTPDEPETPTDPEPEQPEDDNDNMNYEELKFYVGNVPGVTNQEFTFAWDEGSCLVYKNSKNSDYQYIELYTSTNTISLMNFAAGNSTGLVTFTYDNLTDFNVTVTNNEAGAVNPIISLEPIPAEPTVTKGGMVKFVRTTVSGYKNLATIDESTLYFVADKDEQVGDLYRGSVKMTYSAQIVTDWPTAPLKNTLYVNTVDGCSRVFNGTNWFDVGSKIITSETVKDTDWTQNDTAVPTMKAVGSYVSEAIKDVTGGSGVVTSVTKNADGKAIDVNVNGTTNSFTLDGLIENIQYTEATGELTLSFTGEKSPIVVNLPKEQALTGAVQHIVTAEQAGNGIFVNAKADDVGLLLTVSNLTDATEVQYFVSLENFIDRYTQGNGILIDSNHVVSIKKNDISEEFLSISEAGIAVTGVRDAIDTAAGNVKDVVSAYTVNGYRIDTNPVLNGADVKATGYSKSSSQAAITTEDTVNVALGKLEKKADDAINAINAMDATTTASTAAEDTTAIQGVSVVAEVSQTDGKVAMTTVKADKFGSANKALIDAKKYTDDAISNNSLSWEIIN